MSYPYSKLHQVNETTCQLYVACESAHTHLHEKHGRLAKIVHQVQICNVSSNDDVVLWWHDGIIFTSLLSFAFAKVMKNIEKPENVELYKDDAYLMVGSNFSLYSVCGYVWARKEEQKSSHPPN